VFFDPWGGLEGSRGGTPGWGGGTPWEGGSGGGVPGGSFPPSRKRVVTCPDSCENFWGGSKKIFWLEGLAGVADPRRLSTGGDRKVLQWIFEKISEIVWVLLAVVGLECVN